MDRRRFVFWMSFGLFTLSERFNVSRFDKWAAMAMRTTEPAATPNAPPTHWTSVVEDTWRWFERETWDGSQWLLTGITQPIQQVTGERKPGDGDYLADHLVPPEVRNSEHKKTETELRDEFSHHHPSDEIKARHGRPPSEWLRSLNAEELHIFLKTIDPPEAGVSGMTFWEHLTRDHLFDAKKIEGLVEADQAKLHAAAHAGY